MKSCSTSFITQFEVFFNNYPQFEETTICDLIKNAMNRFAGDKNTRLPSSVHNLFMVLYTLSPKAANLLSANVFGPTTRNMMRACKKADSLACINNSSFLTRTIADVSQDMVNYIQANYDRSTDVVTMSLSIDATKVPQLVQEDTRTMTFVGGAYPDHCIDSAAMSIEEKTDLLESFHGSKPTRKIADEIKVATAVFQRPPSSNPHLCPYKQVKALPQTKNKASSFNKEVAEAAVLTQNRLRADGWRMSFTNTCNDGVSCDSRFTLSGLSKFLKGSIDFVTITDPCHNGKSCRYQGILGGNSVKTIGSHLIDTGLLKAASIKKEAIEVKDFASDVLVLDLYSSTTVQKVLQLQREDPETQLTLCFMLFFMRAHLFAVNSKGVLTSKQRVTMLWSALIFFVHVDGAHITTKRNIINEIIGMCFLILREDVIQPHRLTSEPSEHSFAILRCMIREFTVLMFIYLVHKLDRLWIGLTKGNLRVKRQKVSANGYFGSISDHFYSTIDDLSGNVPITYFSASNGFVASSGASALVNDLWPTFQNSINGINVEMEKLLSTSFGVKEFHPLVGQFQTRDAFISCYERILSSTDDMFKKEYVSMDVEEIVVDSIVRVTATAIKPTLDARIGIGLGTSKESGGVEIRYHTDGGIFVDTSLQVDMVLDKVNGVDVSTCNPDYVGKLLKEAPVGVVTIAAHKTLSSLQDLERQERIHSRDPTEEELKHGLKNRMIQHVIAAHKGTDIEYEEGNDSIPESVLGLFDLSDTKGDKSVFEAFLNTVTCAGYPSVMDKLLQDPNIIVTAMNKMHLGSREKGRTDSLCKFKSLLGRYFSKAMKTEDTPTIEHNDSIYINRGSIVSVDGVSSRKFMVTVIWKANATRNPKYWPSDDTPNWIHNSKKHGSRYRLGVREVNIQDKKLSYLSYGGDDGLYDGVNVRNCYRLVTSVDRISMVYGSVIMRA